MYNKEQAEIREIVYRFCGKCFLELPTEEFVAEIYESGILQDFPVWSMNEWIENGKKDLQEAHDLIHTKGVEAAYQEIKTEYTRLFIGPQVAVPLWESVYTEREGLTFGESTLEVRDFYRRHNLQIARLNREPDDHMGYELEFVASLFHLIQKGSSVETFDKETDSFQCEGYVDELYAFLRDHLLLWIDQFAARIVEETSYPLFAGLVRLTQGLLISDFKMLSRDRK